MTDANNVVTFKPKTVQNVDVYFGDSSYTPIVNTEVDLTYINDNLIADAKEYLALCKKELEDEDYRDVLCGIMDYEIYNELEKDLQNIVDTYYTHTGSDLYR